MSSAFQHRFILTGGPRSGKSTIIDTIIKRGFWCSEEAGTGLVPRQYSTGGRTMLLGISKRGNKKIRTLLVQCARVFIQKLEHQKGKLAAWVRELLCRKSNFVVTCALANKLARIAWALTTRQQTFAS